jgi:hypothetical protein
VINKFSLGKMENPLKVTNREVIEESENLLTYYQEELPVYTGGRSGWLLRS